MKFADAAKVEKPQKVLVYGPPKTGKTELVARLVEAGYKLLWVDMENGWQTIKTRIDPKYWDQIELFVLPDTKENPCAYPTFARMFTMKPVRFCHAHGRIACVECTKNAPTAFDTVDLSKIDNNTVVVGDSLTQLSASAMNNAAKGVEPTALEFKHYAAQGAHLDALLTAIQQAPFHVAIISHEGTIEGVDGKETIGPVGGTKNFSLKVPKYFDHVVYTTKVNKEFRAASSANFNVRIMAGSRSDLAMETKKCTLADLFKANPVEGATSGAVQDETPAAPTETPAAT